MSFNIVLSTTTLIALLIASYSDLKTREVPDWINYGLIFTSFGIRSIYSLTEGWSLLLSGVIGFAFCFIIAHLFYYTNQWGGGDSKLLMAMGAVVGIPYPFTESSFQLIIYFVVLLVLGAIYGTLWIIGLGLTHHQIFFTKCKEKILNQRAIHYSLIIFSFILALLTYFNPLFLPLLIIPLPFYYLFVIITVVEENFFIKSIPLSKVTLGDWLAEDIMYKNKLLLQKRTLDRIDIELLQKNKIKNISIKEGIPFVPSFLFAYIALNLSTNLLSLFQNIFI